MKPIEDQGKKQLDAIKNINADSKPLKTISHFNKLIPKVKALFEEIKKEKNDIGPEKLACAKTDGKAFNINRFKILQDRASNIFNDKDLRKDAENKQYGVDVLLKRLKISTI